MHARLQIHFSKLAQLLVTSTVFIARHVEDIQGIKTSKMKKMAYLTSSLATVSACH